jgi:hypothetical protein
MEVKMQKLSLIPKGKKGASAGNELLGWIILFGLIGLIGAIFGLIQSEVEDDVVDEVGNTSYAYNNSQKAQEAQGKIFGKLPLVGTIVVLTLILMLVLGVVAYFQNRNAGTGQVS